MKNELFWPVIVVVIFFAGAWYVTKNMPLQTKDNAPSQTAGTPNTAADPTQLQIADTQEGTGSVAENGKKVTVNYTGYLSDGTKFDSSIDRGQPFTFTLGTGEVIKGWDLGVAGMKVGGKRKLVIPSTLAYGEQAVGSIPANSTLYFDIELLGIE